MSGFYHKHFLKLLDFTPAEINSLLQLAAKLKADKKTVLKKPDSRVKTSRSSSKKTRHVPDALSKLPHMTGRSRHLSRPQRQPDWS